MERKKGRFKLEKIIAESDTTINAELFDNLNENETALEQIFLNCSDLVVKKFNLFDSFPCMLVYLDVIVDATQLEEGILRPLLALDSASADDPSQLVEQLNTGLVPIGKTQIVEKQNELVQRIVKGEVILFIESSRQALSISVQNSLHRELQEPNMEAVIRGPRLGFIETLSINMALIRQRIRSPQLKIERISIGTVSQTDVAIVYIGNMAPQTVIDEIRKRILGIDMDSVLESGYIEEMISDHPYSPFPLIQSTQRPDSVTASLIEGKVVVLIDGSPMALIAPITIWYGFQTAEDYYMKFIFATMLRWLRYLFAFLSIALPAIYVAVTTFHQEMLPTSLALSLAAAREIVPFPALMETLIMEVTFEALREAGVRLPRPVGQTISIVGALVIGQAAVQAGIISAPIIIIVSLTGIASFLIPHPEMSQAISILRFPLIISAGTFGLYGVGASMIAILIHLVNLRSFGVPYLTPLAPVNFFGLEDVLVRAPWQVMRKRQEYAKQKMELEKK